METNNLHALSRTELMIGTDGLDKLQNSKVIVFGIGGVGSFVAEALARSGIGHISLVDGDTVSVTNCNRQLIATSKTIGQAKVSLMKSRILEILPQADVTAHEMYYTKETAVDFDLSEYDYIVDAIDMVTSKLLLIENARGVGVPIICSMGTGNKLHPELFEIEYIEKTSVCPLAKVMRKELKKRGIQKVRVVYSKELPLAPSDSEESGKRQIPASIAFVPPVAGMILAGEVVRELLG
ncbi:MAG: tRNA threonylcarbamoyladenosine dehydratase [Bacillota bacterium]